MACGASGGESSRHVIWICSSGVVCLVAGVTIGRRSSKYIVDVAAGARNGDVSAGQREGCVVVVEDRACPRGRRVACRAGRGESRRQVVWICGACVIRLVAGITIGRRSHKDIIYVAGGARDDDVSACQRERGAVV